MGSLYEHHEAIRVSIVNGKMFTEKVEELLVKEHAIDIYVHGIPFRRYSISPSMVKEFIYGNLISLGVIDNVDDVEKIEFVNNVANVHLKIKPQLFEKLAMSYGVLCEEKQLTRTFEGKVKSNVKISATSILEALKKFHEKAHVFKITGGVHSAALFRINPVEPMIYVEDIGRHNAIDKIVGWGFLRNIDFGKTFILTSGRVFLDSVIKVAKAGIPIIVSKSAPTLNAVLYAERNNITLIGFARGRRFNVYSCYWRILDLNNIT